MTTKQVKYTDSMQEIEIAVKSSSPFVWVRTHEEARFLDSFCDIMEKSNRTVMVWSLYQGMQSYSDSKAGITEPSTADPIKLLDKINTLDAATGDTNGFVIVMKDPMVILQAPVVRRLRDLRSKFNSKRITLVFLSPIIGFGPEGSSKANGLHPTLEKEFIVCNYSLPSQDVINQQLRAIIKRAVSGNAVRPDMSKEKIEAAQAQIARLKYTEAQYVEFSRALQGLTENEVEISATSCLHFLKTLDADFLIQSKKQIISRSDILEYLDNTKNMEDIGGMDLAKEYLKDYAFAHTKEAQEFGVEPLKAVLLLGIPGCGKSQLAKAVASLWKLPLLRMDVGKVMTGLVGGSEQRMRDAISQVEAVQPCILWIDEIEKGLSGTKSSGFSDGGTLSRVFGTLLTSMEEGMKGVTIIATANDISALPPEFIRRFDEVFFVDLPGPDERKEIFNIHLRLKNQTTTGLDLNQLITISENFTGHEIEKAVKRAITFAYKATDKKLTTELIAAALVEKKPLFETMKETLIKLRGKANERFRFASSWARDQNALIKKTEKKMDMNDIDLPSMDTVKSGEITKPEITLE